MKSLIILIILNVVCLYGSSQPIVGQWNGKLNLGVASLRLVFHIEADGESLKASMDSPDQHAAGIPASSAAFADSTLKLAIAMAGIEYEGKLVTPDSIAGTFKQMGRVFPLSLKRGPAEPVVQTRPQEPQAPFPYQTEEVTFDNPEAGIRLAGTLTKPAGDGPFAALVLISGSGPQNRDEELFGHKPFAVIADYLTRQGMAVLRYDDRGTARSEGIFATATTYDLATDAEAAFGYLKSQPDIDPKKIGLAGHSEGALIAPLIASRRADVAFLVLLAGPGTPGSQILVDQAELIGRASGTPREALAQSLNTNRQLFDLINETTDTEQLKSKLKPLIAKMIADTPAASRPKQMSPEQLADLQIKQLTSPWMIGFIRFDPAPVLAKVHCPVLALNGELDLQVPPTTNSEAIREALETAGNKQVEAHILPGLNHLFQPCKTGLPAEYAEIQTTIAPEALHLIGEWLCRRTR